MAYTSRERAREYAKQYYQERREEILAKQKVRAKKKYKDNPAYFNDRSAERKKMLAGIIQQQKVGKSCIRCGISDPRILDFHHVDSDSKVDRVSAAVGKNWSIKRLLDEIAKCETVCANCHRILHWEERNGE